MHVDTRFVNARNLGSFEIIYKCKKNTKIQGLVIREIFAPVFLPTLSLLFSAGEFKTDKLKHLKWSFFKRNYVWVNSRPGKTVCKCRRSKIKRAKNNPVNSIISIIITFSEWRYGGRKSCEERNTRTSVSASSSPCQSWWVGG